MGLKDGAAALFPEAFYFVTNRDGVHAMGIIYYLNRGEARRSDVSTSSCQLSSPLRHAEMAKNEEWAQFLALFHNVQVDPRVKVDGGEDLKPQPSLESFLAFALKLANIFLEHSRRKRCCLSPQHLQSA